MLLEAPPGDSAGLGGLHDLSWEHPTPPARTSTTLTVPHPPTSSSRGLPLTQARNPRPRWHLARLFPSVLSSQLNATSETPSLDRLCSQEALFPHTHNK